MTTEVDILDQALTFHRAGDLDRAQECYRRILDREPENPVILHLLGTLAHQRGRHDVAVDLISRAIAADDSVAEFHNTLGAVLQAIGRSEEAVGEYRLAIMLKPDYAEAYNNMAMVLHNQDRCSQAVEYYRKAVQLAPDCAEIYFNLANALRSEGRLDEAVSGYKQALELRGDYAEAHNNLAITLREQGQLEQAIDSYKNAIRLNPGCAAFHSNLASLLQHQGRIDEAISHCEQAVSLDPDSADAHYNLGSALRDAGRCDEAIVQNDLAIRLRPDYAEAHWNQAIVHLLRGNFQEGWRQYEWRRKTDWHASAYPHRHRKPRWNGESFVSRRLLVHCEQGIGDCVQFLRYLPSVKALGGTVVFEAWKSLHGLLAGFDGIDELVELSFDRETQAQFDAHVSIMDLPGLFGTTEQTIPDSVPYVDADPIKAAVWSRRLAGPDLKVGIVWAGSARHANDHNRSCRLEHFAPLSQIESVRLYGLQKGEPARQANEVPLTNLGEQFDDFTDAAAAIENLDLIISVDTSILHLAGAMGKPVWALLA
ncbi:MAG: tetratricopeptide repeat protein, partial [Phycisphaerales bacterium]